MNVDGADFVMTSIMLVLIVISIAIGVRACRCARRAADTVHLMVAHELRTPLTVALSGLSLLSESESELDASTRQEVLFRTRTRTEEVAKLIEKYLQVGAQLAT